MTLEEYKNEIKELRERIKKLEAEKVEEPQPPKRWKPKYRETYYLVDSAGHVDHATWDNARVDERYYSTRNCFKTEEEADEYKKQIEYTAKYKNYIEEHSDPIDWEDTTTSKYFAYFNCESDEIEVSRYSRYKQQGTIYASSEQIILDAINEIGEDNFKKYVLEVE